MDFSSFLFFQSSSNGVRLGTPNRATITILSNDNAFGIISFNSVRNIYLSSVDSCLLHRPTFHSTSSVLTFIECKANPRFGYLLQYVPCSIEREGFSHSQDKEIKLWIGEGWGKGGGQMPHRVSMQMVVQEGSGVARGSTTTKAAVCS